MPRIYIIICCMVTFLSGCASTFIGGYKEPQDGQFAELTVKNDTYLDISQLIQYKEARNCSGGMAEMLKDEKVDSGDTKVTMISAGQPLAFYIAGYHRSMGMVQSCGMTGEFTPEAGESYVLTFSTLKKKCTLHLRKKAAGSDELISEPMLRLRKKNEDAYWNTDPHCHPEI